MMMEKDPGPNRCVDLPWLQFDHALATKGDWRPRAQVWFLSSVVPKTLLFHKNFNGRNGHVIISLVEILVEQESFWNF